MITREVKSTQNTIDSRDVIERLEWLTDEGGDEFLEELAMLQKLNKDGKDTFSEWEEGIILIREDYFVDYCEELLQDMGYLPKDFPQWIVIDWKQTAAYIAQDYSSVYLDGQEYYGRD